MDLNVPQPEEDLESLTNRLSENVAIVFSEEDVRQAKEELGHALVVKLVGDRGYNRAVFKDVLRQNWNVKGGLRFVEVENGILMAKFSREEEMERVLKGGPWRYMGWAVLVEKWEPEMELQELFSNKMQIWLQIHKLPVMFRQDKFASRFAEKAGRIIKYGSIRGMKEDGDERQVYVRYLIEIDLSKRIVPGWELARPSKEPLWVEFRYERLPNICFKCGKFTHEATQCQEGSGSTREGKFGPWLRAEHVAVERMFAGKGRQRRGEMTETVVGIQGGGN